MNGNYNKRDTRKAIKSIFDANRITQQYVANVIGCKQQAVSALLKGDYNFTRETANKWSEAFGFSVSYLLADTPPIFEEGREPTSLIIPDELLPIATHQGMQEYIDHKADGLEVPLLPAEAHGGTLASVAADPVYLKDCERIKSPVKGVDFALTVTGESMAPEYPNGAIVFVKRVEDSAFIEWGCVYVVDTVNGAIIKQLAPAEDEGYIRCVSLNNSGVFAPFEVARKHVHAIYRVLGLFIRK